ncbi:MAG: hypothetical protein J2P36_13910 [Ktedonobacteraceae bacterium]|nr:hypothetical protein [Ktedonobacteraceae bacterium]
MRLRCGTHLRPLASHPSSGQLSGRWLLLVRCVWIACALLLLANFVASIPAYYHLLNRVCPFPNQGQCTDASGQLAPVTIQLLANLHLSLSGYAAFFTTTDVLVSLVAWGVGLLIFWRKSAEPIGLLVSLLLVLLGAAGGSNTLLGAWAPAHPSFLLALLLNVMEGAQWIGLGAFLLTFPTGRMTSSWSWLILGCWITSFVSSFTPWDFLGLTGFLGFGGTFVVLIYRYRRVFTAMQRQQTKWVIYTAVVGLSLLTISLNLSSIMPATSPFQLVFPTLTIVLPAALLYPGLGFAMLRYRLWDIDLIIKKTLAYAVLTSILALIYLGLIVSLQALAQALTRQSGENPVLIVASTLVIAALFQPLRRSIQAIIDRRFYRRQYDAQKTIDAFRLTLHAEVDVEQLCEHVVMVVQETMQPSQISFWLLPLASSREALTAWERPSFAPEV